MSKNTVVVMRSLGYQRWMLEIRVRGVSYEGGFYSRKPTQAAKCVANDLDCEVREEADGG